MSDPVPILVSDVVLDAVRAVPDIGNPSVTAANTYALSLFQKTHQELLGVCQLLGDATFSFSLNAGQKTYPIPAFAVMIWEVMLYTSADATPTRINQRNKDWLDAERPGWRGQPPGTTPGDCYLDGVDLGLVPTPSVGNGTGFPQVKIWNQSGQTLALTDSLPAQVQNADAWKYGMLYRHAADRRRDLLAEYGPLWTNAKQDLIRAMNKRLERDKPAIRRWYPRLNHP